MGLNVHDSDLMTRSVHTVCRSCFCGMVTSRRHVAAAFEHAYCQACCDDGTMADDRQGDSVPEEDACDQDGE